jgi:hypothetical protein
VQPNQVERFEDSTIPLWNMSGESKRLSVVENEGFVVNVCEGQEKLSLPARAHLLWFTDRMTAWCLQWLDLTSAAHFFFTFCALHDTLSLHDI